MKKILVAIMAVFTFMVNLSAQDKIEIKDVQIPEKGSANLAVNLISQEHSYIAFQFDLKLPAGISAKANPSNLTERATSVSEGWAVAFKLVDADNNIYNCIAYNSDNAAISGTSGTVLNIVLTADETLGQGYTGTGKIQGAIMSTKEQKYSSAEGTFNIEIIENRLVLDENAEEAPEAAENVNVKVLRTINANNWSTICLPFEMSEEKVVKAFGDDVQIAEFTACKWDEETEDISLTFTAKAQKSIEANHPLLIKVSQAITHETGFNVDNVTIAPDDAEISVLDADDNEAIFIGTYEPIAKIGKGTRPALFIAQNKFWYSKGTASLKPYRAYFEIDDLKNFIANAKIGFFVDDEATAIDGVGMQRIVEGVYDLSGRKIQLEGNDLNKLQKGVYIIDGKKVTIK